MSMVDGDRTINGDKYEGGAEKECPGQPQGMRHGKFELKIYPSGFKRKEQALGSRTSEMSH